MNKWEFLYENVSQKKQGKGIPNTHKKGKRNDGQPEDN
jgi:hypothetical protein